MTYAPAMIKEVRAFLKGEDADLDDVELGIGGGPSHILTGTSYHLGADQLKMSKNPYSARTARDKAGLADPETDDAACALDIDDDLDELRELSVWCVEECRKSAPDTLDIREIIYSPDGVNVYTWDREKGVTSLPEKRGDSSHRGHSHVSWYRDATRRSKVDLFKRFYLEREQQPQGDDDVSDAYELLETGQRPGFAPGDQTHTEDVNGEDHSLSNAEVVAEIQRAKIGTKQALARLDVLAEKVDNLATGGIDLDVLADKIAARMPTPQVIAKAVTDEIAS